MNYAEIEYVIDFFKRLVLCKVYRHCMIENKLWKHPAYFEQR